MSYKNPNVTEILERTEGVIGEHLHRSYLNLAKCVFYGTHGRKATLDDAQELRDLYEDRWYDYYVDRPLRAERERELSKPLWEFGKSLKIDVVESMIDFLRDIVELDFEQHIKESNYGTYIVENGLTDHWETYVHVNRKKLKYVRKTYTDFSHLAYNGVANDF